MSNSNDKKLAAVAVEEEEIRKRSITERLNQAVDTSKRRVEVPPPVCREHDVGAWRAKNWNRTTPFSEKPCSDATYSGTDYNAANRASRLRAFFVGFLLLLAFCGAGAVAFY